MFKYITLFLVLFSNLALAEVFSYGGRHEIAIDVMYGSFRHVHNWSTQKNKELFFDFANHEKYFSPENDFSYVEYIDRSGNVLFHSPAPALSILWSFNDQIFVGISNVKLRNPYQLVVWDADGKVLYKAHFSADVVKFTTLQLFEFKEKYPEADELLSSHYFSYHNLTYCDCLYVGKPHQLSKEAWDYITKLSDKHPYVYSSETVTNNIYWLGGAPKVDEENHTLIIPTQKSDPIVIKLPDKLPFPKFK